MKYLVKIKSDITESVESTICDERELAILVSHLDKQLYEIEKVDNIANIYDYKEFCVKEKELETGKK